MGHICHLTSVHSPFDTRIFHKECLSLVEAGYQVTLIAPHTHDETVQGVRILALPSSSNRMSRMTLRVWRLFQLAKNLNADLYHFHDPELILLGMLLKAIGKKVIYDVHEDVPGQTLSKGYLPWIIRKPVAGVIRAVELFGAKTFDAIVSATPKIAEHFPTNKTVVVQNFPIGTELIAPNMIPYKQRALSFVYVGVITTARGGIEMVRSFELLHDISGVRLELAGKFSPSSLEDVLLEIPGSAAVHYHGQVSRAHLAQIMGGVRAGLVLFHPLPNHIDAQPHKMFEYMSASLPVIASDFSLWRQIIDGAGCGLLVDPLNPKAIAEALRWILDHPAEAEAMGRRGRKAVEFKYNWDTEAIKLINLYNKLLNPRWSHS